MLILDSCYSDTATRKPKDPTERIVEVVFSAQKALSAPVSYHGTFWDLPTSLCGSWPAWVPGTLSPHDTNNDPEEPILPADTRSEDSNPRHHSQRGYLTNHTSKDGAGC